MNIRKIIREELDRVFTDIHGKSVSDIEYTGVVVEGDDIKKFEDNLSSRLEDMGIEIPSEWKTPENYHMTITLGEIGLRLKMTGIIGEEVELTAHSIGISDKAIAVGVSGMYSKNEIQHITVAFKDTPAESNNITNWIEFEPFKVTGYIREIQRGNKEFGRISEAIQGIAIKALPRQFDHLKWKLNDNQKHYLSELCDVDPNSITETTVRSASKYLGIPESNMKSILNTYNTYNPMSEGVMELPNDSPFKLGNKPITVAGAGMNVHNSNRKPVRANRTTYPLQDTMTKLEKQTMDYAISKNRILDRTGKPNEKERYYESVYTSLMMYLFCEVKPKDIKLNHNKQIQIDQEPILLEGENFSTENFTFRKVKELVNSFNGIFNTNFRISEHVDLSETKHKCHRTFVEHFGISDDKLFWCKERKSWIKPGQHGYDRLREEYINSQGQQMSMPEIPRVDHKELLRKYFNGDLISFNPNSDWIF
jgi:hypothetical protein